MINILLKLKLDSILNTNEERISEVENRSEETTQISPLRDKENMEEGKETQWVK